MGRTEKNHSKRCPVCFTGFLGFRNQVYCSKECCDNKSKDNIPQRMIIQHWQEREDEKANDYSVCATFNCGKRLSLMESLASHYCTNCAHERELINKENIFQ